MEFVLIKNKKLLKEPDYKVKPTSVWTALLCKQETQMTGADCVSYLWCKRFHGVQGGERELKGLLQVFGQLIVVIKDRKYQAN